jgi:hypothetical protein
MRTMTITCFDNTQTENFITKSLKNAINTIKMLFHDIGNLALQQIDNPVVKFPTDMVGNKLIADSKTKPKRFFSDTG